METNTLNSIAPLQDMSAEYAVYAARHAEKQAYRDKREQARKHQHDRDEE